MINTLGKILIVVTSHSQLGNTGKPTGYYLPEVAHPALVLEKAGYQVDIASPQGGKAPMDERSRDLKDPINKKFLETSEAKLNNTLALKDVDAKKYKAIIFAGGHGTMWDFADDKNLQKVATQIYEDGGVVSAVCHGPAALVNIKLSSGKYLVDGKKVTGFTNAEEEAVELTKVMPFLLESKLKERGATFNGAGLWQNNVVVDGRLVTGQNPASAGGVGEAVAKVLSGK